MYLTLIEIDLDTLRIFQSQAESTRVWARNSTGRPRFYDRVHFLPLHIIEHGETVQIYGSIFLNPTITNNEDVLYMGRGDYSDFFGRLGLGTINFHIPDGEWEYMTQSRDKAANSQHV